MTCTPNSGQPEGGGFFLWNKSLELSIYYDDSISKYMIELTMPHDDEYGWHCYR